MKCQLDQLFDRNFPLSFRLSFGGNITVSFSIYQLISVFICN